MRWLTVLGLWSSLLATEVSGQTIHSWYDNNNRPLPKHLESNCEIIQAIPIYRSHELNLPMRFVSNLSQSCVGTAFEYPTYAIGKIVPETLDELLSIQRNEGGLVKIEFHSPGGDFLTAIRIGETLRGLKMHTELGNVCLAACVYALIGGATRSVVTRDLDTKRLRFHTDGARLGLQQFMPQITDHNSTALRASDLSRYLHISGIALEYVIKMGIDTSFYTLSSGYSAERYFYLTPEKALELGIDNVLPRYSRLELLPFGNRGAYARTIRQTDQWELRIFCEGSNARLRFAVIVPGTIGDPDEIKSWFSEVEVTTDRERMLPTRVVEVTRSSRNSTQTNIVFEIQGVQHSTISSIRQIRFDVSGPRPTMQAYYLAFEFTLNGDMRLLNLAMRNCI